jgi:hypothetical protein
LDYLDLFEQQGKKDKSCNLIMKAGGTKPKVKIPIEANFQRAGGGGIRNKRRTMYQDENKKNMPCIHLAPYVLPTASRRGGEEVATYIPANERKLLKRCVHCQC